MSTDSSPLSNLLFGQIRSGVLALLYGQADRSFYVRQIARHVDASVGAVQRELEQLARAGLIVRTTVGHQVFYQVNQQSPVFPEMRALVGKTVGVFDVLRSALSRLSNRINVAFVYGSVARHEETSQSDVDVMIIGNVQLDDVLSRLSGAEAALGRAVNPSVYAPSDFRLKLESGSHFLNAVAKGRKIFLLGGEDEFKAVAGAQASEAGANQSR